MVPEMENSIRALRKERGISQEELAKRCGVTRQTVNAIENNKYDPTLALAFHLAQDHSRPTLPACRVSIPQGTGPPTMDGGLSLLTSVPSFPLDKPGKP